MINSRNSFDSISVSEFVMLLIILLLILIGFISSNPQYFIESFIVGIIAVIMFAVYLYIKKYAKLQSINRDINELNSMNNYTVYPTQTIGILTVIMPFNTNYNNNQTNQMSEDMPPNYEQINRLPTYEEIVQNH
jgi:general stress protein CsbA